MAFCNKNGYDKKGAQSAANLAMRNGRVKKMRIYHCEYCEAWHITHTTGWGVFRHQK